MLATVHACATVGLDGHIVDVEVDFNPRAGIPSFTIVGLPDAAVKESRERVRSAIKNSNRATARRKRGENSQGTGLPSSTPEGQNQQENEEQQFGLQFPNKSYVVNLFPADLPKHSTAYDLSIAVGVLAVTDQVPLPAIKNALFVGELSLDGSVRHVKGVLPMAYTAKQQGYSTIYVPAADAAQAALISEITVIRSITRSTGRAPLRSEPDCALYRHDGSRD